MRKYKSGSRFAFWRWTITDSDYIRRLHIIMTPWFAICLHFIRKPDVEPHLHDHPVSFLSLVLKGWYRERRRQSGVGAYGFSITRLLTHRWYNFIRASEWDQHKIVEVSPGGCITLCFMTGKKRDWGFHTENGWVGWREYYAQDVEYGGYIMSRKVLYKLVGEGKLTYPYDGSTFIASREDFYKRVQWW